MKAKRHDLIASLLAGREICTVAELASALDASPTTVRRDLDEMARDGRARRVRGGAMAPIPRRDRDEDRPFHVVALENRVDKDSIARRAADLVRDGDVIIIDIGTTASRLAHYLVGRSITVITTSLPVLDILRQDRATEVIITGGQLRRSYQSLVGVITEDVLAKVRADLAFLGTSGVDGSRVLDTSYVEVGVKRTMMAASARSILLADHTKFPGRGTLEVCPLSSFDAVVTDVDIPPAVLEGLRDHDVEVLLP